MAAKGTRVTPQEKDKMWQLYQEGNTFAKIARKLQRSPDTVSRYVHEREAEVNAVRVVVEAQNTPTEV